MSSLFQKNHTAFKIITVFCVIKYILFLLNEKFPVICQLVLVYLLLYKYIHIKRYCNILFIYLFTVGIFSYSIKLDILLIFRSTSLKILQIKVEVHTIHFHTDMAMIMLSLKHLGFQMVYDTMYLKI